MDNVVESGKFEAKYQKLAAELEKHVRHLIVEKGMTPEAATSQAMSDVDYKRRYSDMVIGAVIAAAEAGINQKINADGVEALKQPWDASGLVLSEKTARGSAEVRRQVVEIINDHMRAADRTTRLAKRIYDGYGNGGAIPASDLPKYLSDLEQQARRAWYPQGNDLAEKEYRLLTRLIRQARANINKLEGGGTTDALKAGYNQIIKAVEKGNAKSLNNAIYVAINERSRYYAERIGRTELARAWYDGFIARTQDDPNIRGYRYRLSSRHPTNDICDMYAHADMYGLGAGIYPKNKVPKLPVHPHCLCRIVEVYFTEIANDGKRVIDDREGGGRWLNELSDKERRMILGIDGNEAFLRGEDWRNYARNYESPGEPISRFRRQIELSKSTVSFNDKKLLNYSLDKDHKTGGNKAIAFEMALGYNKDNYQTLKEHILNNLDKYIPEEFTPNEHGQKFSVVMEIEGVNGKKANVLTAWILDTGAIKPRNTNAYVTKKKLSARKEN